MFPSVKTPLYARMTFVRHEYLKKKYFSVLAQTLLFHSSRQLGKRGFQKTVRNLLEAPKKRLRSQRFRFVGGKRSETACGTLVE